jgi:hypothetical protein
VSSPPEELNIDTAPPPTRGASNRAAVPESDPYHPGRDREKVRTRLAIGAGIVTAAIGLTLLLWSLIWHNDVNALLTGIFTPFFGLTGTVIGFYFGGQDATKHGRA